MLSQAPAPSAHVRPRTVGNASPRIPSVHSAPHTTATVMTLTTLLERRVGPPWGVFGGADGAPYRITLEREGTARDVKGKETVRLGTETLFTGRLGEAAIEAGVSAVEKLVREARSAGAADIRAVATCALREASDAPAFQGAVASRAGVSLEVISGEEEARLIHLAARSEFPAEMDPLLVMTIVLLVIGLVLYFAYGYRNSTLRREAAGLPSPR